MIEYEKLKNFKSLLEEDQAPSKESGAYAYDEGRHIYSVEFQCALCGEVSIRVHVQWGIMEQLLVRAQFEKQGHIEWYSYDRECVFLRFRWDKEPNVTYVTVLYRDDLEKLCEKVHCLYTEEDSAEGVWARLYCRGAWGL